MLRDQSIPSNKGDRSQGDNLRSHECERGTHECVRHNYEPSLNASSSPLYPAPLIATTMYCWPFSM